MNIEIKSRYKPDYPHLLCCDLCGETYIVYRTADNHGVVMCSEYSNYLEGDVIESEKVLDDLMLFNKKLVLYNKE